MKKRIVWLAGSVYLFCGFSPAWADDAAILARVEALEQEIKVLKRQLEVRKEEEAKKTPETPIVTASAKDGFSIKSPDDGFKLRIRGQIQADGRFFTDNRKDLGTTDTFTMRRIRPSFEGTVSDQFDFLLTPSFDGGTASVQDAYAEYRHAPELRLRAGKFKVPFELERLQSTTALNFVEFGFPAALSPGYDVGAMVHGDLGEGVLAYALGAFDGTTDGSSADGDLNNDKEVAARAIVTPFKHGGAEFLRGLSGGLAVTVGHAEGASLPTLRSIGQAAVFSTLSGVTSDGEHLRLSPQMTYYDGPFGFWAEYVSSEQSVVRTSAGSIVRDEAENEAWQLLASVVLTGEDASYKGVAPRHPFNWARRSWGAFELLGRYNRLDIDDVLFLNGFAAPSQSVTAAESWGTGINWYLNRNVKLVLDYEYTQFEGGAWNGAVADRPDESAVYTRVQLVY